MQGRATTMLRKSTITTNVKLIRIKYQNVFLFFVKIDIVGTVTSLSN